MSAEFKSWEQAVVWLRMQPEQQDLVRACFYDDPLVEAAKRYAHSSEWLALRQFFPTPGRALDLGAGRGITSFALAQDGWQTTAVEPDDSPVVGTQAIAALAVATGVPIEVIAQYGESLPLPERTFDLVYCRAVLHHARDLRALCREAARVLRPGGMFVATREHVISRTEDLPRFLAAHPLHRLYGGEHAYLLADYIDAIGGAGLTLRRILNPFESDVNLFPDTKAHMKERLAARIKLPFPRLIPDVALTWLGKRSDLPGRHYSFLATKPT